MGSSSSTRQVTDVTIPEGYTIDQVFALLDERGVTSVENLRDMAANYDYAFDWLRDRPLGDYHRLEGYLFPDTYTFEMGENPKYVINKMLVNFAAVLTLSGTGYDKLFVGTKAEAEKAADGFIDFVEDAEGKYTFTVSVPALDEPVAYAAHASKSGEWYDRGLTFEADSAKAK